MLAVELRPEETRGAFEDFIRPPQLTVLLLELTHPPGLRSTYPGALAIINIRLPHPRPYRLSTVSQLRGYPLHPFRARYPAPPAWTRREPRVSSS